MFRCQYNWVLCLECYAPPAWGAQFTMASEQLAEEATFGVTSLLWECSKCQAVRNERLLGKKVEKGKPDAIR